jgi:WhiB family transcriptional regulator, redox-sensing transcriptional regulator
MTPYLRTDGPIHGRTPRIDAPAIARINKLVIDDPDPGWQVFGACNNEDPELFFPVSELDYGPVLLQVEDAKNVCYRCPVIDSCRSWALNAQEQHGIWGGMTAKERAGLKRQIARAKTREAKQAAA